MEMYEKGWFRKKIYSRCPSCGAETELSKKWGIRGTDVHFFKCPRCGKTWKIGKHA